MDHGLCPQVVMSSWEDDRSESYKVHNQQNNCGHGIKEHGMTPRNKVSGMDKGSVNGDHHYHSHLTDVAGESFTADS